MITLKGNSGSEFDIYAANARREVRESRRELEPYLDADLLLTALKTKEFENVVVTEWETANDLQRNYQALLGRAVQAEKLMARNVASP